MKLETHLVQPLAMPKEKSRKLCTSCQRDVQRKKMETMCKHLDVPARHNVPGRS